MTLIRLVVLTVGPLLLIGGAYALSYSAPQRTQTEFAARLERAESRLAVARTHDHAELAQACRATANELRQQLPENYATIVREPFILAGDIGETDLDRLHRESVGPVTEALWRSYFDRRPDQPVIIVALSNEQVFRQAAWKLDGYKSTAYAGYTQRSQRRLVFNLATGNGTLTHELSHILAYFDFPDMPEWFDEGLAALHEETVFSADGLTLMGTPNWRNRLLRGALDAAELPMFETLVKSRSFRGEGENLNYAYVRCFCLYLQERGLLSHFYRKFRDRVGDDPSGLETLRELLGGASDTEIDRDFRAWAAKQPLAR